MWLDKSNSDLSRAFNARALSIFCMFQLQVRYRLGGVLVSFSSGIISRPSGTVTTLRSGTGVVHGTTLVGAAGRGCSVWIVGCVGLMASRKIAVVCDRSYSFLLWFFLRYLEVGGVVGLLNITWRFWWTYWQMIRKLFGENGVNSTVSDTQSSRVSGIYTL